MSAASSTVAAGAGHRRCAAIISRSHRAGVATRNRRRIAAEVFIGSALRERRIRGVSSPGDVLDAGSGVTASIRRNISDGASMSATISAIAARASDSRIRGAVIRRSSAVHVAVRNSGRIATEVFVGWASRELRVGRVNRPSDVLDARSAVLAGIGRHVGDGARMSATIDAIAARAGDGRICGAVISCCDVVHVAVRNGGRIAAEVFVFSALRERWVGGVDGPGDFLDASCFVAAMIGGHVGDRALMTATFSRISRGAGDDGFAAIICRRNLGQIAIRNRGRIATEIHFRRAGSEIRVVMVFSPIDMLRATRALAAVVGDRVNEVAFMDATGHCVRTSGSANDIGDAAVSSDGDRVRIAGRDGGRIAAKVRVASAGDGRRLVLGTGQLQRFVKAGAAFAVVMDQRLDGHRERSGHGISAVGTGGVDVALVREIRDRRIGAERRVAAVDEVLEFNDAVTGAADFSVKRAAGGSEIGIGKIDFEVAGA